MSYKYYFKKRFSEGGDLPAGVVGVSAYPTEKYNFKAECHVCGEAVYDRKLSTEEIIKYDLIPDYSLHIHSAQKPIKMVQCPQCGETVDLAHGQCHRCGYIFQ